MRRRNDALPAAIRRRIYAIPASRCWIHAVSANGRRIHAFAANGRRHDVLSSLIRRRIRLLELSAVTPEQRTVNYPVILSRRVGRVRETHQSARHSQRSEKSLYLRPSKLPLRTLQPLAKLR